MMRLAVASLGFVVLAFGFGQTPPAPKAPPKPPTKGFPAVAALFKANCLPCHQGPRAAKFDVTTYEGIMKGGEHGKVVVPGKTDKSPLIAYLKGTKTPQMPMRRPPLKVDEIKTVSDWIAKGAKKG
ncbi:hypothetical protein BH11ARM2_BH11ARM2_12480 [soil metagenome]